MGLANSSFIMEPSVTLKKRKVIFSNSRSSLPVWMPSPCEPSAISPCLNSSLIATFSFGSLCWALHLHCSVTDTTSHILCNVFVPGYVNRFTCTSPRSWGPSGLTCTVMEPWLQAQHYVVLAWRLRADAWVASYPGFSYYPTLSHPVSYQQLPMLVWAEGPLQDLHFKMMRLSRA